MSAPQGVSLPNLEAEAFAFQRVIPIPNPGDPPFLLRFLRDEIAIQVGIAYENYLSRVADLSAQALQAQAEMHKQIAGVLGRQKG